MNKLLVLYYCILFLNYTHPLYVLGRYPTMTTCLHAWFIDWHGRMVSLHERQQEHLDSPSVTRVPTSNTWEFTTTLQGVPHLPGLEHLKKNDVVTVRPPCHLTNSLATLVQSPWRIIGLVAHHVLILQPTVTPSVSIDGPSHPYLSESLVSILRDHYRSPSPSNNSSTLYTPKVIATLLANSPVGKSLDGRWIRPPAMLFALSPDWARVMLTPTCGAIKDDSGQPRLTTVCDTDRHLPFSITNGSLVSTAQNSISHAIYLVQHPKRMLKATADGNGGASSSRRKKIGPSVSGQGVEDTPGKKRKASSRARKDVSAASESEGGGVHAKPAKARKPRVSKITPGRGKRKNIAATAIPPTNSDMDDESEEDEEEESTETVSEALLRHVTTLAKEEEEDDAFMTDDEEEENEDEEEEEEEDGMGDNQSDGGDENQPTDLEEAVSDGENVSDMEMAEDEGEEENEDDDNNNG